MPEKTLRLLIVTPEKTLLDESVSALSFPLYDGGIGILPGRLPLIGRLGTGELKVQQESQERLYFIDGGFVQVRNNVVTLLTNNAVPAGLLTINQAQQELETASKLVPTTEDGLKLKSTQQQRARRKLAIARKAK